MKAKKYKLPKQFTENWVSALRSGRYIQGKNFLVDDNNKYCCLGVACIASGYKKSEIISRGVITEELTKIPNLLIGSSSEFNIIGKLTRRNDSGKWDFNRIADWIESNIELI